MIFLCVCPYFPVVGKDKCVGRRENLRANWRVRSNINFSKFKNVRIFLQHFFKSRRQIGLNKYIFSNLGHPIYPINTAE